MSEGLYPIDAAITAAIKKISDDMDMALWGVDDFSVSFGYLSGWKRSAAKRMYAAGVERSRILDVIAEMDKSGNFPPCPNIQRHSAYDGGTSMREPIQYSHVTEVGEWPKLDDDLDK